MPTPDGPLSIDFAKIKATEETIVEADKAQNTMIAYRSAWNLFSRWCEAAGYESLPATPRACKDFVTWCVIQGYRLQTIESRLSAVTHYHRQAGLPRPIDSSLQRYILGAKRLLREEPGGKTAINYELLARIIDWMPVTHCGTRNRTMILLAFATGWRRSEVVSLRLRDLQMSAEGMRLYLRSSKTDKYAEGRYVGVQPGSKLETCPVGAMREWLELRGDWAGPLFVRFNRLGKVTKQGFEARGGVLNDALKSAVKALGEDDRLFGAHSLRAGMITEAARAGASELEIMQRTGHRSITTLQKYIRPTTVFAFNPLRGVL